MLNHVSELTLDKVLGTGAFCEVREIKAITLKRTANECPYDNETQLIPKPKQIQPSNGNKHDDTDEAVRSSPQIISYDVSIGFNNVHYNKCLYLYRTFL